MATATSITSTTSSMLAPSLCCFAQVPHNAELAPYGYRYPEGEELLSLVRSLSHRGLIVIMALHDLTQAYRASDKILFFRSGLHTCRDGYEHVSDVESANVLAY